MAAPIVYLDPNVMSGILLYGFAGALSMEALSSLFVHTLDNDAFQVPAFHPSRGTDPSFADLRVSSWPLLCSSQCFISADQRFSKTCKELIKESVFARSSVSVHIILDSVVQRGSRADSGG